MTPRPEWRTVLPDQVGYMPPDDYERLLKPYRFGADTDLALLRKFARARLRRGAGVLELGCGTGRGVLALLEDGIVPGRIDLLDLSEQMSQRARRRLQAAGVSQARFFRGDIVNHLRAFDGSPYDFVFALWSFSHSVHQHLLTGDPKREAERVEEAIESLVSRVLAPGASFFLIHLDSLSDEQHILMKQWARLFPRIDTKRQSLSFRTLEAALESLRRKGLVEYEIERLTGDPIRYADENEALETMMNFHLEAMFNGDPALGDEVAADLAGLLRPYRAADGSFSVRPGCFRIVATRA